MKYLFAVKDIKLGAYLKVLEAENSLVLIRDIQAVVLDPNSQFCKYPEDFSLWEIGTFNEETGELHTDSKHPKHIQNIADIKTFVEQNKEEFK